MLHKKAIYSNGNSCLAREMHDLLRHLPSLWKSVSRQFFPIIWQVIKNLMFFKHLRSNPHFFLRKFTFFSVFAFAMGFFQSLKHVLENSIFPNCIARIFNLLANSFGSILFIHKILFSAGWDRLFRNSSMSNWFLDNICTVFQLD